MQKKCDFCDNYYDDSLEQCPSCGAPNPNIRKAIGIPQTIEELQQWYVEQKLPPKEVTRFFIGENYKGARAFGIYKDENTGHFIVYKNKSDGSRAIRYEGKDESYAVNELYVKLKEEIADQKSKTNHAPRKNSVGQQIAVRLGILLAVIVIIFTIAIIWTLLFESGPSNGYYNYNNKDYYYQNGSWYYYDDVYDDWYSTSDIGDLDENYDSYYGRDYDSNASDFEDSGYYDYDYYDDDDDYSWDSDSSWDSSDSWDSGGSDWDSDW